MSERTTVEKRTESTTDRPEAAAAAQPTETSDRAARRRPRPSMRQVRQGAGLVRVKVANVVWFAAALCAAVLAIAALLVVFKANHENQVVQWFTDGAAWLAGPLGTVFEFQKHNGSPDHAMNRLVNWGIAALVFLVAGRFAHRLVRPSS